MHLQNLPGKTPMLHFYKQAICTLCLCALLTAGIAQQPALLINRFFTNPGGDDSPYEFAELVATRSINFATEPYTVVFADGGNGGTKGWATGSKTSYAFQITSGTIGQRQLLYAGGSSLSINGSSCKILRQINTGKTGGDGFGSAASGGVLGNGGNHADGLAVFSGKASSITAATVPADAVFFGSGVGDASKVKFTTPHNDLYNGGLFGTNGNTFLAPDPAGGDYVYVSGGAFSPSTSNWSKPRSFAKNTTKPNCQSASNISFGGSSTGVLSFSFDTTSTTKLIKPPYISGVISDPKDPAAIYGIIVSVKRNDSLLPASAYTLPGLSSNPSVVSNSNILVTKSNGSAKVQIIASAVGYSNITLTLTDGSSSKTLVVNYAASAASLHPISTRWHTSISDASAAIALDTNYMVIGNDETNYLYVYNRHQSGLPLTTYYYGDKLSLTDGTAPDFKEVDLEAGVRSTKYQGRTYWLGSMSNSSGFNDKPNRNRLFAINITGTGSATLFSYVGKYSNLRKQLISWGDKYSYDFSASAAEGQDPKLIDGFNVEGMCFAPDNKTLYIGFRAPLVPITSRRKAVIAPISNFETWFNNGSPSGNPSFGSPIELDLSNRGIRDLFKLSNGQYLIVAGNYDDTPLNPALFAWNGLATGTPVLQTTFDISGLNAEGVMETTVAGSSQSYQIISDNGTANFYNDGTEAKDLVNNEFKKFRSDVVSDTSKATFSTSAISPKRAVSSIAISPNPVTSGSFHLTIDKDGKKEVRIYNWQGNLRKLLPMDSRTLKINVSGFEKGYYMIVVTDAAGLAGTATVLLQ